jgi:PKD repeat protein
MAADSREASMYATAWVRFGRRLAAATLAIAVIPIALVPLDARAEGGERPDLVVQWLSDPPDATVPRDERFTVDDVVRNGGERSAPASSTHYFLEADGRRHLVGTRAVPELRPGEELRRQAELALGDSIEDGAYTLIACADALDEVAESTESNNCRASERGIVVDGTAPPAPAIDAHPDDPSRHSRAQFVFTGAGVRYACRVDDTHFERCQSPYETAELGEGLHRFEVMARDAAGNRSPTAAFSLTLDLTPPPVPEIREHPPALTSANSARFTFTDVEPEVSYLCALDDGGAVPCESPKDYPAVPDGDHRFTVVARDAAGNESGPATFSWTVAPDQTLGDGAWSWFADPRAIFDEGRNRTYVGWVARDGDIKVSAFDHSLLTRTTALVAPDVEADDHANPALQVLADGRLRVYYSAHGGTQMWYRTSLLPGDISAWEPVRSLTHNSIGTRGYTYPNPIYLAGEHATYLFWRGGNYNPTFSVLADGDDTWSPPRTLVSVPNRRPYVKFDSNGSDTIAFAFTNDHPREGADVDIYYAEYRDGVLRKADGTPIGTLESPITPAVADKVYDSTRPEKSWVHDVALDSAARPVIVFARFPSLDDHRYMYVRWTGTEWTEPSEITPAGGSFNPQANEEYYSGGITLDHEDPSTVYLSRQINGVFEVETWTTPDGGASWSEPRAVTAGSDTKNVRPVSPRGLTAFGTDLSVIWMRGAYNSYIDYRTSITTMLLTGGNDPPVADATPTPQIAPAGQKVTFDAGTSNDPDGTITAYEWDFGDGGQGSGRQADHVYHDPGRYFATLTVTDDDGGADRFVMELEIGPFAEVATGPATDVDASSATLHGRLDPRGQPTTYRFEYGATTSYGSATADEEIAGGETGERAVQARLSDLPSGRYHYRLVATSEYGTVAGDDRLLDVPPAGPGAYAQLVRATPGLVGYWRLGELDGPVAHDETDAHHATLIGPVRLGEKGALFDDPDSSARFDGEPGEMTMATPVPRSSATLEGWFDWRTGVAVMRDHTGGGGWILAYSRGGLFTARVSGTDLTTTLTVASLRGAWHHVAVTVADTKATLYLDGEWKREVTIPTPRDPALPWHVMRNGTIVDQYTQGRADEIALYNRALSRDEIAERYRTGAADFELGP